MPSPFPGMDPWIESTEYFGDFHDAMIYLIRSAINERAPKRYAARGTQLVWMDDDQIREPDVGVLGRRVNHSFNGPLTLAGALAVEEEIAMVEVEQRYLEIFSKDGMRLVTVIEILSRSNKRPGDKGRDAYLQKQKECKEKGGASGRDRSAPRRRARDGGAAREIAGEGRGVRLPREHCHVQFADSLLCSPHPHD